MLSDVSKRRALHAASVMSGLVCCVFAWLAVTYDSKPCETVMILLSVVFTVFATASLLVVFVTPLAQVYRSGYEAGQHSPACVAHQVDVQAVIGGGRTEVIPIRKLRAVTRADN